MKYLRENMRLIKLKSFENAAERECYLMEIISGGSEITFIVEDKETGSITLEYPSEVKTIDYK